MFPKATRVFSSRAVEAVRARDPYCRVCGGKREHVHHIKSRGAGGDDDVRNMIGLCSGCHSKAHAGVISRFRLRHILSGLFGFVYEDEEVEN